MSVPFDQAAPDASRRDAEEAADRAAKWLVGDRLACVLHLGDGALAYRLSDQGHEVVVAGDDVVARRSTHVNGVRTVGDRLPFAGGSFDAVVVPHLDDAPSALAEHARVLRPRGLVSSFSRSVDESLPWVRRLREIIGERSTGPAPVDSFAASGLFHDVEDVEVATWEKLDLAGLLQFARATASPSVEESAMAQVHRLFTSDAAHTGHLRLRHVTRYRRARVDKAAIEEDPPTPETTLLDFR